MGRWEVLIVPAIAVVVWILATIFRGNDGQKAPPRRSPDRFGDVPPQRRPTARVARPPAEFRRTTPPRPEPRRPIVLEEVREPLRAEPAPRPASKPIVLELAEPEPATQTRLEAARADYRPSQSPSKPPIEKPLPAPLTAMLAPPQTPQTSLEATRADYAPTQSPSQLPVATAAKPSASSTLLQVRQLLRSPQSAAVALVLREILDAPRCRRRHL